MTLLQMASAATATTNPAPNSLTTVNPLPSGQDTFQGTVSAAWTSQNVKMIAFPPSGSQTTSERQWLRFVPSSAGATFTVTAWRFGMTNGVPLWEQAFAASSNSYTGATDDYYENLDNVPVFFQLSNISTGSVAIYYDSSVGKVY